MALDPSVDEPLPLGVRRSGQLEDVAVQLEADTTLRVGPKPSADRAHERRERLGRSHEADDERARHESLDRTGALGRRAAGRRFDRVDVELEQLRPQAPAELFELVLVCPGAGVDRELECGGLAVQTCLLRRRGADSCYCGHKEAPSGIS
jgi:hypothetical protein